MRTRTSREIGHPKSHPSVTSARHAPSRDLIPCSIPSSPLPEKPQQWKAKSMPGSSSSANANNSRRPMLRNSATKCGHAITDDCAQRIDHGPQTREILMEESNVQPVRCPVTVCGDIHGQFVSTRAPSARFLASHHHHPAPARPIRALPHRRQLARHQLPLHGLVLPIAKFTRPRR